MDNYLLLAIIFVIIIMVTAEKSNNTKNITKEETACEKDDTVEDNNDNEEYPYIRPYLLTKKEWAFYKALKPIAGKYRLHILAKVRLADLITVKSGLSKSARNKALTKILSKHIDFVIANPNNLAVLCAIELDDITHEEIDRQQRDHFVEKACEAANLPLLRVRDANNIEEKLCSTLKINVKK